MNAELDFLKVNLPRLKELIERSITQDQISRDFYLNKDQLEPLNYYQGKIDALKSVLFYFRGVIND